MLSLLHVDCAPQNYLWDGEAIRIIDFEYSRFGLPPMDFPLHLAPLGRAGWPTSPEIINSCRVEYMERLLELTDLTREAFQRMEVDSLAFSVLRQLPSKLGSMNSNSKELFKARLSELARGARKAHHLPDLTQVLAHVREWL